MLEDFFRGQVLISLTPQVMPLTILIILFFRQMPEISRSGAMVFRETAPGYRFSLMDPRSKVQDLGPSVSRLIPGTLFVVGQVAHFTQVSTLMVPAATQPFPDVDTLQVVKPPTITPPVLISQRVLMVGE